MAWWRRGRRGCGPDVGVGAGLGSGRLSRAGSAVTLEVPRPGRRCLWGAFSADIPENAPGRRGCRRRAAGYGAENDSAVTAAPGAPGYRVRPQRPRGRRCAARGRGRRDRGRRRSRAQLPSGLPGRRRVDEVLSAQPRPARSAFPGACLSPASAAGRSGRASLMASNCAAHSITRRRRRAPGAGPFCSYSLKMLTANSCVLGV